MMRVNANKDTYTRIQIAMHKEISCVNSGSSSGGCGGNSRSIYWLLLLLLLLSVLVHEH